MPTPAGQSPDVEQIEHSEHAGDACARAWIAWHGIHAMITDALTAELGKAFGLALNEFEVLTALQPRTDPSTEPVRLRLGDLGRHVTLSQPAISRLVTRLEERGLIRRLDGAVDRRSVLVEATPEGIDLYRRAAPVHAAAVAQHLGGHLTDAEQETLANLITRLHDKVCADEAGSREAP
jgi:DNA-binding MarR family transcriptional regulator